MLNGGKGHESFSGRICNTAHTSLCVEVDCEPMFGESRNHESGLVMTLE